MGLGFCGTPMKDDCGERGARCGGESGRGSWYMTLNLRAISRFWADALPGWGQGWAWGEAQG